jgi:hypothetical protein
MRVLVPDLAEFVATALGSLEFCGAAQFGSFLCLLCTEFHLESLTVQNTRYQSGGGSEFASYTVPLWREGLSSSSSIVCHQSLQCTSVFQYFLCKFHSAIFSPGPRLVSCA